MATDRPVEQLNLAQQRKRAKALLKRYQNAEAEALQRFQKHHPQTKKQQAAFRPRLSDAQWVIAREQGLPSWPKLKAHIERMALERQEIAAGNPVALDADIPTLHLRCGSDIQQRLKTAGFVGDFLAFVDPYCQGPVPSDADFSAFLAQRSAFIARAYGIAPHDAHQRLIREYDRLHNSASYPRVVLWFEHDAYDQLTLAHVLHHYGQTQAPQSLELICIQQFPGIERFVGLGQLSPESLRLLWETRQSITPAQLRLGQRVWQALTTPSPTALVNLVQTGTPAIPTMAPALRRHLQELPWLEDGLGLTERLTLEILADLAPLTAGRVFGELTGHREPLPYLGDTMYWRVLQELSQGPHPLMTAVADPENPAWYRRSLRLTPLGRAILNRQAHRLVAGAIDRWVGGIQLRSGAPIWCWDEAHHQALLVPPNER
ncbi:MAG: DUF1835 domain-containing protein [Leptolyngbyaceae cyanobacterium]